MSGAFLPPAGSHLCTSDRCPSRHGYCFRNTPAGTRLKCGVSARPACFTASAPSSFLPQGGHKGKSKKAAVALFISAGPRSAYRSASARRVGPGGASAEASSRPRPPVTAGCSGPIFAFRFVFGLLLIFRVPAPPLYLAMISERLNLTVWRLRPPILWRKRLQRNSASFFLCIQSWLVFAVAPARLN